MILIMGLLSVIFVRPQVRTPPRHAHRLGIIRKTIQPASQRKLVELESTTHDTVCNNGTSANTKHTSARYIDLHCLRPQHNSSTLHRLKVLGRCPAVAHSPPAVVTAAADQPSSLKNSISCTIPFAAHREGGAYKQLAASCSPSSPLRLRGHVTCACRAYHPARVPRSSRCATFRI